MSEEEMVGWCEEDMILVCPERMLRSGINGEGNLRGNWLT